VVGDGFIFVDRDFPTPEKKLFKSSHCFWHSESSKSLLECRQIPQTLAARLKCAYCYNFLNKISISIRTEDA